MVRVITIPDQSNAVSGACPRPQEDDAAATAGSVARRNIIDQRTGLGEQALPPARCWQIRSGCRGRRLSVLIEDDGGDSAHAGALLIYVAARLLMVVVPIFVAHRKSVNSRLPDTNRLPLDAGRMPVYDLPGRTAKVRWRRQRTDYTSAPGVCRSPRFLRRRVSSVAKAFRQTTHSAFAPSAAPKSMA